MSPDRGTPVTVEGRELRVTNLDKVLYPAVGFTKGDLIDYYVRIAPVLLPHLRDRPLTMKRFPDGVDGQSFYGKHLPPHAPGWVRHVTVPAAADADPIEYTVLCDLPTLVWAANLASIELHVPLWHVGRRRRLPAPPDYLVFDLDPGPGTSIVECCRVARLIAPLLDDAGLQSEAKTSGSKGLQVYARLPARWTWERSRSMAHDLALRLEGEAPELVVSNMRKELRRGKVLIDWSQNHPAKTTVAAYSLRATREPTVSTPVSWDEVAACADGADPDSLRFTASEVLDRVHTAGDRFADLVVPASGP